MLRHIFRHDQQSWASDRQSLPVIKIISLPSLWALAIKSMSLISRSTVLANAFIECHARLSFWLYQNHGPFGDLAWQSLFIALPLS